MENGNPQTTIGRFQSITPDQFEQEINALWQAAERVKDTVVTEVQSGALPPLTGLAMVACITGQAFQYGLFHGQPAPADLIGDLNYGLSSRELAGQQQRR